MGRRILFLCTGNSCRSQMAEAWGRRLLGDEFEFFSAGVIACGVDPLAVAVMAEVGVDMSGAVSKCVSEFAGEDFDLVVTLCDHARESCPVFDGALVLHRGFEDPPSLAALLSGEDEKLAVYRRVRDEIGDFVRGLGGVISD